MQMYQSHKKVMAGRIYSVLRKADGVEFEVHDHEEVVNDKTYGQGTIEYRDRIMAPLDIMARYEAKQGDYLVCYEPTPERPEPYLAVCPKDVFERGYRKVTEQETKPWEPFTAAVEGKDYHPAVCGVLKLFGYAHLRDELAAVSRDFADLAIKTAERAPFEAETTIALRKLLEGRDAAVRAFALRLSAK